MLPALQGQNAHLRTYFGHRLVVLHYDAYICSCGSADEDIRSRAGVAHRDCSTRADGALPTRISLARCPALRRWWLYKVACARVRADRAADARGVHAAWAAHLLRVNCRRCGGHVFAAHSLSAVSCCSYRYQLHISASQRAHSEDGSITDPQRCREGVPAAGSHEPSVLCSPTDLRLLACA